MSESQDLLIELLEKQCRSWKQARIYEGKTMGKTKRRIGVIGHSRNFVA